MAGFPVAVNAPSLLVELMEVNSVGGESLIRLSRLGDRSLAAMVPAATMGVDERGAPVERNNFNDGDEIDVLWRGVDSKGVEVSWSQALKVTNRSPARAFEFQVPSDKVKALAGSKAFFSYQVTQGPNSQEPGKILHSPALEISIDGLILEAPQVVEAVGDSLDPEKLGGTQGNRFATVTVDYPAMALGDIVEVYRNGNPVEDIPISDSNLRNRPLRFQWKQADLVPLTGDVMTVHYVVYRGQPEQAYISKVITLRVGPSLVALPPFINEVKEGRLEPGSYTEKVFVHIPPAATLVGDMVNFYWVGAGEVGSLRDRLPVTARNVNGDLKFDVYENVISPNRRRLVKVYYTITRLINGRTVTLRSPDLNFFVGTAEEQQAFTQSGGLGLIEVKEAADGVLDTTPVKDATLVVPFAATQAGDEVSVYWRIEGEQDSQLIGTQVVTAENVDSDLTFTAPASLVDSSVNKRASIYYVIKRPGDPEPTYLESPYTNIRVGPLTGDQLLPPRVIEANEDDELDPMQALDGATVEVPAYPAMAIGDQIKVTWDGGPGPGTVSIPVTVSKVGPLSVKVPASAVAYSVDYRVLVSYEVIRASQSTVIYSPSRLILELGFYDEELTVPRITQAPNGVLDLSTAADPINVVIERWPHIAPGQRVWLRLEGVAADGTPLVVTIAHATGLSDAEVQRSLSFTSAKSEFARLKNGSRLKVVFKVAWDGDVDETEARLFPAYEVEIRQPGAQPGTTLSIASHDLNLGGYFALIDDAYRANPTSKSTAIRTATGGRPPYRYSSSNPAVARVDAGSGKVSALRNGVAIITVTDQDGATVTYRVIVTGVHALEKIPVGFHTYEACNKDARQNGLRIPTLDEWKTMRTLSSGKLNLPYLEGSGGAWDRRVWTSTTDGYQRVSFWPDDGKTQSLADESVWKGESSGPIGRAGETAHGFGLRD
ncbi:Ig-like domain-containing protein [Pseudomonas sp. DSP3-2-2]|uniref:Ig-like domain-containing protein n=1 Tax=unclassified Pseudomonas TaxID=196821 RepID=UPI003CF3D50B